MDITEVLTRALKYSHVLKNHASAKEVINGFLNDETRRQKLRIAWSYTDKESVESVAVESGNVDWFVAMAINNQIAILKKVAEYCFTEYREASRAIGWTEPENCKHAWVHWLLLNITHANVFMRNAHTEIPEDTKRHTVIAIMDGIPSEIGNYMFPMEQSIISLYQKSARDRTARKLLEEYFESIETIFKLVSPESFVTSSEYTMGKRRSYYRLFMSIEKTLPKIELKVTKMGTDANSQDFLEFLRKYQDYGCSYDN